MLPFLAPSSVSIVVVHRTPTAWEGRGFRRGGDPLDDKDARAVLRLTPDLRRWQVDTRRRRRPERKKKITVA